MKKADPGPFRRAGTEVLVDGGDVVALRLNGQRVVRDPETGVHLRTAVVFAPAQVSRLQLASALRSVTQELVAHGHEQA